jgi:peptidoglycan/xylan/chitin deacetylase (PgdA/CDA1 family)
VSAGRVTVLMYHRLGSGRLPGREEGEEVYAVTPESFEEHLEALAAARARVIDPEKLHFAPDAPPGGAEPRVCLTFDDGNRSDYSVGLPALRRRGWQALFFVVPAWVGEPGYLSWPEVRELRREGMEVGAHGFDHTWFARLDDSGIRRQLREARRQLESELGTAPAALSLPGGSGGRRAVRLAREAGFVLVATSDPRLARPEVGLAPLPRFALRRGDSPETVRDLAEQRPAVVGRWRARHQLLNSLRALLGEGLYARVRARWVARGEDAVSGAVGRAR